MKNSGKFHDSILTLVDHALATMPDSVSGRRQILTAALNVLQPAHPAFAVLQKMQFSLNAHEAAQRTLPMKWGGNGQ